MNSIRTNITTETAIAVCLSLCIPVLLIVLYRNFRMPYGKSHTDQYDNKTYVVFIAGISIPFATILIMMLEGC